MFLKTLDKKQKFNLKNLNSILTINWHLDLHGLMNLNLMLPDIGFVQVHRVTFIMASNCNNI